MSDVILAHVYFHALPEDDDYEVFAGVACGDGCVPAYIVSRSDYDQLKADSEVMADLAESRLAENLRIKAENERLERKNANQGEFIKQYQDQIDGGDLSLGMLILERDTLRTQLDEARELLSETTDYPMLVRDKRAINAWLERNKP